ncbi:unnamed protein product, partial [Didymodactylos carnosus]
MSTITYPDISHKKQVTTKFSPNSYRVITEEVSNDSLPPWYTNQKPPPLYTGPNEIPTQVAEARNNPHAARKVDMVYENVASLNGPYGIIKTDNVSREENRWWDWSQPTESYGPRAKVNEDWKKRYESSYRGTFGLSSETGPYTMNSRHSSNPNNTEAVGIVPVTEMKQKGREQINQKLVEKVSFENQYDSRTDTNYPLRGRRHGAFVVDLLEPKPLKGTTAPPNVDGAASAWDLFHPTD